MSLAMYAAPFDMDSYVNTNKPNDNIINKKRTANNRTQKRYTKPDYNSEKVNSVLQSIHSNTYDNDNSELGDFNPPPPPTSIGVENTQSKETTLTSQTLPPAPHLNTAGDDVDINNLDSNYGNGQSAEEYYKKFIPNYLPTTNPHNRQYYQRADPDSYHGNLNPNMGSSMGMASNSSMGTNSSMGMGSNDILLEKLNYMINLLEEQQDDKTNNVTEEVILYCFLGIFIIFIIDSFSRVGKYVR